ncbi:GGDEF domain-containing protein [Aliidiomarina taiwanensis]|uniref:diguanylate cyclase n=1 Tax=Aliidiomarina taiwanensis TaxID=946228 RepID=A0A432XAV5_9GAMM|nr:GGDEF domain-containing protein [Aliidiomarina taiwanensis]RUO44371.1 GGDEF domain-containing protein [Aliidiomarina taiwanensis]
MTKPTPSDTHALKTQLAESNKIKAQIETTYKKNISTITKFVGQLSHALRGVSGDIDQHLSKIQSTLQSTTRLDDIMPVMEHVDMLLRKEGAQLQRDLQESHQTALSAAKQLQQTQGLPQSVRLQVRDLLCEIEEPAYSIQHYLPCLNKLLALYQQSLKLPPKADDQASNATIKEELINLLSFLELSGNSELKLKSIQQQLMGQVSSEQLSLLCVQIIRIIVQSMNEERRSAQAFLLSLDEVLNTVSSCVSFALNDSKDAQKQHQFIDNKLDKELTALAQSTRAASSLAELKSQVSSHMVLLVSMLNEKKSLIEENNRKLTTDLAKAQARIAELESAAEAYKDKLNQQRSKSLQDPLTRLPNRAAFDERLKLEFNRWQRYGTPLAIAIADIDNFKDINDTYGHIAGDKTLQVISSMLKKSLRATDFVARYGGEEFVILLPQTEAADLAEPLQKTKNKIQAIPFKFKDNDIRITISIGAAVFSSNDAINSAFERADKALYAAKKDGRNKVVIDKR